MLQFLRITAVAISFGLGAAFLTLMFRSYSWSDAVVYEPEHGTWYTVRSFEGNFMVRRTFSLFGCSNPVWRGSSHHLPSMKQLDVYRKVNTSPSYCGGQSGPEHSMYWIDIPHWLVAIIVSLPGVILLQQRPSRFSLRSAMLVTTAVALLFGLAIAR
jgi:hypothetical protein